MKRKRKACQFCSENNLKQKPVLQRLEFNERNKGPGLILVDQVETVLGFGRLRFSGAV
jgi:hypothetical protein